MVNNEEICLFSDREHYKPGRRLPSLPAAAGQSAVCSLFCQPSHGQKPYDFQNGPLVGEKIRDGCHPFIDNALGV